MIRLLLIIHDLFLFAFMASSKSEFFVAKKDEIMKI